MRLSTTRSGFRELMTLQVQHGELTGEIWSPAPLDDSTFGELHNHGRAAAERESVWVAMSDGRLWYCTIDVRTAEVLSAHRTGYRCLVPEPAGVAA